jgi:hypothetical protein
MITLYVTPVFYVYMDRLDGWIKGRRRSGAGAPGAADVPLPAGG